MYVYVHATSCQLDPAGVRVHPGPLLLPPPLSLPFPLFHLPQLLRPRLLHHQPLPVAYPPARGSDLLLWEGYLKHPKTTSIIILRFLHFLTQSFKMQKHFLCRYHPTSSSKLVAKDVRWAGVLGSLRLACFFIGSCLRLLSLLTLGLGFPHFVRERLDIVLHCLIHVMSCHASVDDNSLTIEIHNTNPSVGICRLFAGEGTHDEWFLRIHIVWKHMMLYVHFSFMQIARDWIPFSGEVLQLTDLVAELLSLAHAQGVEGFLAGLGSLCEPAHHKWHLRPYTKTLCEQLSALGCWKKCWNMVTHVSPCFNHRILSGF